MLENHVLDQYHTVVVHKYLIRFVLKQKYVWINQKLLLPNEKCVHSEV